MNWYAKFNIIERKVHIVIAYLLYYNYSKLGDKCYNLSKIHFTPTSG